MSAKRTGITHKGEKMAINSGAVNSVIACPAMGVTDDYLAVKVIEEEGIGEVHYFRIPWDHAISIPENVELFMMEFDCLPSWGWYENSCGEFEGQFAHYKNRKTSQNFSAESK